MKHFTRTIAIIIALVTLLASCQKSITSMNADELLDLGEKYLRDLNYEKAEVYFERLIEVEPKNPRGYTGLAEALIGQGDEKEAAKILNSGFESVSKSRHETIADYAFENISDKYIERAFDGYEDLLLERDVEKAYDEIGSIAFSDESALTSSELVTYRELQEQKESAYAAKDVDRLKNVKTEWVSFRAAVQARIDEIEAEKLRAAEEAERKAEEEAQAAIDKVIKDAQNAAETMTSFSFGMMDMSITSRDHTIIFTYQYNIDIGSKEDTKASIELSMSLLSYVFETAVQALKEAGITSASVIVEFKDKTGSVIYSKEFK